MGRAGWCYIFGSFTRTGCGLPVVTCGNFMATFTVFFCGTGSNSFDFSNADYHAGELISTLARHAAGMEFVDWIIADGPGSGNLQEDEKFVPPGNYSAATGVGFGKGWEENVAHALAMIHGEATWSRQKLTDLNYRVLKQAGIPIADKAYKYSVFGKNLGSGVLPDRRVTQQALQMQKIKIFRKKKPITQINAIGWSRGAVTTHMFANALALDPVLKDIPVNLIAVDPVPGTGQFQAHRTTIPANVKNYVAFYARDERSLGFAATLARVADPKSTEAVYYPLPGRHATLVGNAGNYIGGNGVNTFYGPGRVVRMLAENYLTEWGTALNRCLPYSDADMLRCYDEMIAQQAQYTALRSTVYTLQRGQMDDRDIGVGQDWTSTKFRSVAQLKPDGLFVNWHHKALFQQLCRTAWLDFKIGFKSRSRKYHERRESLLRNEPYLSSHAKQTWAVLQTYNRTGKFIGPT